MTKKLKLPIGILTVLAVFLAALLFLPLGAADGFVVTASAEGEEHIHTGMYGVSNITVTLDSGEFAEGEYSYADGVHTINTDKKITISGTTTTETVVIASGVNANITLAGVNIDVSGTSNACAFKIADNSTGEVTITLADGTTNVLKSGENCAGLQKNGRSGKLTINGTGTLEATGGKNGAGIGGGEDGTGSGITISGGTVTATGGFRGAGIGGGWYGEGSGITISGGTVTATGGTNGAGIGGGYGEAGSDITISGGTVTATGGTNGAGIGGGWSYGGSGITISGGTVTATGGSSGAGIGGGYDGTGSGITISGGTVTATGGNYGSGIGGGDEGTGSGITISGGSVKAVADNYANAIGGGNGYSAVTPTNGSKNVYLLKIDNPSGAAIYIDGKEVTPVKHNDETKVYVYLTGENHTVKLGENGTVTYKFIESTGSFGTAVNTDAMDFKVTGGEYGVDYNYSEDDTTLYILTETAVTIANKDGISKTDDKIVVASGVSAKITLAGVNIDVSATDFACAFRIADNSTGEVTITIADGTTNVLKSGNYCAGLQKNGTSGKLTINGTGTLEATGGENGAGIGGGEDGTGSGITISGGTVTATGGSSGAGIGGGLGGTGSGITISGGTVTATGGTNGAGIGGGDEGTGSGITISGGTVTATGGTYGAGIGGGYYGAGSGITISGGTVTATGGTNGAGIGGGRRGTGSGITISGGSVKAVAGSSANAIGGGYGYSAVTPTNGSKNVYLLEIDNPSGAAIYIDEKEVTPVKHNDEAKVYVYLTGENHTVKLGENEAVTYNFIEFTGSFGKADNPDAMDFKVTGGEYGVDYIYLENDTTLYILTETAVTIVNKDDVSKTDDKIVVDSGVSANITLAGVNIDVSATNFACAFRIADNSTGEVTITLAYGTTNVLKSGEFCAGLQKNGTSGKLTIEGTGTLEATGGNMGAGIGGGEEGTGSGITISGGTVTATGGDEGAGIGGGWSGTGSGITISGGTVTATGSINGAGIGGGFNRAGSGITISGGTVTATGGDESAGIGGGWSGTGSGITISGGTVTATGGSSGAGIGGGRYGAGSGITIIGGSVKAVAGSSANAIGGGTDEAAVTPTNGSEDVYLLEIANEDGKDIVINGKNYPDAHGEEKKIYAYLPAKTAEEPNLVGFSGCRSQYYYTGEAWQQTGVKLHVDENGDEICDVCKEYVDGIGAKLIGYTLSLNGNIGVNFYMELSEEIKASETAYMQFTLPNTTEAKKVYVTGTHEDGTTATTAVVNTKTYYVFSCEVAAKEMTDTIKAQMFDGNGNYGTEYTYTVKEYADYILNHSSEYSDNGKTVNLVKAMLNYGAYSQTYFGYNTEKIANAGVEVTLPTITAADLSSHASEYTNEGYTGNTEYYGSSLVLNSVTDIKHYFTPDPSVGIESYTCTDINGNSYKVSASGNYIYVRVENIPAHLLGDKLTLTLYENGTSVGTISYSPMSYAYVVLNKYSAENSEKESLRNVVIALYDYYTKALAYNAA